MVRFRFQYVLAFVESQVCQSSENGEHADGSSELIIKSPAKSSFKFSPFSDFEVLIWFESARNQRGKSQTKKERERKRNTES